MRLRFVLLSIALQLHDNNNGSNQGVDAFVNPKPSITTRNPVVIVQNTLDPDSSSLDDELSMLMRQREQIEQRLSNDELSQLILQRDQIEQRLLQSNFQEAPTTTVADLAETELTREKLKREVEDAEKRRNLLEAQLEASKKKQELGKEELRKSLQERDDTRMVVREITGGSSGRSGLFPLASLSLGALALGRSALEARRKKQEGTNDCGCAIVFRLIHPSHFYYSNLPSCRERIWRASA